MRWISIVLLATALSAQGPPPPPPSADGPKQPVSGRVLDAESGRPVRGARVAVSRGRDELATAYSDYDGRFAIDEAPVGKWQVAATKSGYFVDNLSLVVPAAQPLKGVELRIHRQAVMTGRVLDHHGQPLTGAKVAAYGRRMGMEGETGYQRVSGGGSRYEGTTNDRGEYRLWNLRPGDYVVAAFPERQPSASGVLRFGSTGAIYPNAPSLSEGDQIRLGWGQVREGVDIQLAAAAETRLEGRLAIPGMQGPCETCVCILFADDPDGLIQIGNAAPSAEGLFVVEGLAPGSYLAQLRGWDRSTGGQWTKVERFSLSAGRVETLEATLSGEIPVKGRLVLEDPPDDLHRPWRAGVRLMPPPSQRQLGMFTRGMFANFEVGGLEQTFELSTFPGKMRLDMMSGPDAYIAGISLGGRPLESNMIAVPADGPPGELVVRVRFDTGTLEGTVEDPDPADLGPGLRPPGRYVRITPADESDGFARATGARADDSGSFQQRLPAGVYDVTAQAAGPTAFGMAGPALDEVPAKYRKRVEIKPGETIRVHLEVAP